MYYDAVKAAFDLFPLDPPGNLSIGDYIRIGSGGRVKHYGNLRTLINAEIEEEETAHMLEYFSNGVRKGGVSGNATGVAEASVMFSNQPGIYIRGKRIVRRVKNLHPVLAKLANSTSKANWSLFYRIVVETHVVEHADIVCSGQSEADIKVKYDAGGLPLALNADYARQQTGLLHLPDISGTIAFSPIRFVFGMAFGTNPLAPYQSDVMDVNDPESFADEIDDK
ncbi:hypothetical protein [Sphingomonas sp. 37zxx]|uniref:hypothetical protein n=1 Tax=Sphingomonas sp. 37zxx TaxID=1550073 RepID=UPI0012E00775|nr:hypothetical protein [Sphingomonas sp. 37zxx]